MDKFTRVLKWIVNKLGLILIGLIIGILLPIAVASYYLTDSAKVKEWVSESDSYSTAKDEFSKAAKNDLFKNEDQGSTLQSQILSENDVVEAFNTSVSSDLLQSEFEELIDGIYVWLEGLRDEPEFEFSFSSIEDDFYGELEKIAIGNSEKLRTCDLSQTSANYSLASLDCLPLGVNVKDEAIRIAKEFRSDNEILDELSFDSSDITEGNDGLSREELERGQFYFSLFKLSTVVTALLLLGLSVLVIFTSTSWVRGLRRAGSALISSGLFAFLGAFIVRRLSDTLIPTASINEGDEGYSLNKAFSAIVDPIASKAVKDFSMTMMIVCGFIVLTGVTLYVSGYMIGRNRNKALKQNMPAN